MRAQYLCSEEHDMGHSHYSLVVVAIEKWVARVVMKVKTNYCQAENPGVINIKLSKHHHDRDHCISKSLSEKRGKY